MEQLRLSQRLLAATWKLFNASLEAGLTLLIQTASEICQAPVVYTNELFQIRAYVPQSSLPARSTGIRSMSSAICLWMRFGRF